MKTVPTPVRLDDDLRKTLREGARRTPHNQQALIRLTLRRHLREVIDEEVIAKPVQRVTNIEPWPEQAVKAAYRRMGKDWDKLDEVATRAQGKPDFKD